MWSFHFFTTDIILWSLFIIVASAIFFYRKHFIIQKLKFNIVSKQIHYVSTAIFIMCILIALIDSIHIKTTQTNSVLDILLNHLVQNREQTYSAPFALFSFTQESIIDNNDISRSYARLKHTANHLHQKISPAVDIGVRIVLSFFMALVTTLFLYMSKFLFQTFSQKRQALFTLQAFRGEHSHMMFWNIIWFIFYLLLFLSPHYHLLGTDKTGNEILYLIIKGVRTAIIIGTFTTLLVAPIAIILGILAGYFQGVVDSIIQYIYTTLSSIPLILLIAAGMLLFEVGNTQTEAIVATEKRLLYLCFIIGISSWTGLCRLIRAETLKVRELEFIQSAKILGLSKTFILTKHILPNVMHIIIISIVLQFSGLVLAETILAYVGIGLDPTTHSWGNMINQARLEFSRTPVIWWNLVSSFTFMTLLIFSANILGDLIRDTLDPKNYK